MNTILSIALAVMLVAVAGVLLMGIGSMARGGKHSNKLMRWRVILQGVAVVIILLLWFVNSG